MFKRLYAWLFNKELAYVTFAYGHVLRIVQYDHLGKPFVVVYGGVIKEGEIGRDFIYIRKKVSKGS